MNSFADALWTSLPVPALLIDPEDRIAGINPAGEQFLNASVRSLRGAPVFDRLAIDAPLDEAFARVHHTDSALFIDSVEVGTGHGPPVRCNVQIAPMAGMAGVKLLLIDPRRIADRLGRGRSGRSSARSAIGMGEMLAHEIKNPLAGITGAAQLLAMDLDAQGRDLTDLIVAESRRILALLEQVEQFGNLRPPICRPVNLHDLLDRARKSALLGFAPHMRIVEDYDPSLPPTLVDGDQMMQVFGNLIRNAADAAGPDGGTIRLHTFFARALRVRRRDGSGAALPLQVEIADDGPGLPPDIAGDIFEPFVSGRGKGTGLGLALVNKIVTDHDGWIAVDSVPGRTVFRISLPMAAAGDRVA